MKKLFLSLVLSASLLNNLSLEAALPPLYQGSAEIKAILISKELGHKLSSGDLIETIQRNATGYEIITNKHRLQINVIYLPPKTNGPIPFELKFEEAQSL